MLHDACILYNSPILCKSLGRSSSIFHFNISYFDGDFFFYFYIMHLTTDAEHGITIYVKATDKYIH